MYSSIPASDIAESSMRAVLLATSPYCYIRSYGVPDLASILITGVLQYTVVMHVYYRLYFATMYCSYRSFCFVASNCNSMMTAQLK